MQKSTGQLQFLLTEGRRSPVDYNHSADEIPDWFDRKKFQKGQEFLQTHFFSMFCCMLSGLLCLLSIDSILNVLVFTGKSSTPYTAFRRYFSTILHVISWFQGDVFDKSTRAYKSLQQVQSMHQSSHQKFMQKSAQMVSQLDMVYTQFAFIGYGFLYPHKLGMEYTREEGEGLVHFWKTVGYKMGIEDRFNLCSNLQNTVTLCKEITEHVVQPSMQDPPAKFHAMCDALLKGAHIIVPAVHPAAFSAFTRRMICLSVDMSHMQLYPYFLFKLQVFVLECLLCTLVLKSVIRPILNFLLRYNLYLIQRRLNEIKPSRIKELRT